MCLNELHNAKSNRSLKPVGFRNAVNTNLSDIARGFNHRVQYYHASYGVPLVETTGYLGRKKLN